MIHESSSHVFDLHMFHMIYDLACIFTMDIIDIMISMINISLYVIIMLLIYGIKMTWKLPIILTAHLVVGNRRKSKAVTRTRKTNVGQSPVDLGANINDLASCADVTGVTRSGQLHPAGVRRDAGERGRPTMALDLDIPKKQSTGTC